MYYTSQFITYNQITIVMMIIIRNASFDKLFSAAVIAQSTLHIGAVQFTKIQCLQNDNLRTKKMCQILAMLIINLECL